MSLRTRRGLLLVTRSAPELRGSLLDVLNVRNVRIYQLGQRKISPDCWIRFVQSIASESHTCFTLLFGSGVACVKSIPSSQAQEKIDQKIARRPIFRLVFLHQKRSPLRPETFFGGNFYGGKICSRSLESGEEEKFGCTFSLS